MYKKTGSWSIKCKRVAENKGFYMLLNSSCFSPKSASKNTDPTKLCFCFRTEGDSRERSGPVSLREAKTQRDGTESQQHGGGIAGPEDR